jgi:ABC-type Fe3+-hydroxamate transport system substrate-binding protein
VRRSAETPAPAATRIVSLAPSFTETVVALGAADRLVGIGAFDPPVPGRPDLPRLGDAYDVSLETIVALRPDLLLANGLSVRDRLAKAGLPVFAPRCDRLDEALEAIREIGERIGRQDAAAAEIARIRAALDAAGERARRRDAAGGPTEAKSPERRALRVLVVVERRPLHVAGGPSYLTDLLRAVGAENAAADVDSAWPALSEEAVAARAPDVVLDASEGENATPEGRAALLASWARHASVPAVRNGRVHVLREDALFRPGPSLPVALAKLEAILFPTDGEPR